MHVLGKVVEIINTNNEGEILTTKKGKRYFKIKIKDDKEEFIYNIFTEPRFKQGDMVEFDYTENGQFRNLDGFMKVSGTPMTKQQIIETATISTNTAITTQLNVIEVKIEKVLEEIGELNEKINEIAKRLDLRDVAGV